MNAIGTPYIPPSKRDSINDNNSADGKQSNAGNRLFSQTTGSLAGSKRGKQNVVTGKKRGGAHASQGRLGSANGTGNGAHGVGGTSSASDEDDQTPVEEHLILRMPQGHPATTALREQVKQRDPLEDVTLSFPPGSRTGKLEIGGKSPYQFRSSLVDLPCILESQKSFDNKQFYKIADIAQMIVVDDLPPLSASNSNDPNNLKLYSSWPDGITPPLRRVRQRRFRKRMVNTSAELIEAAVENLLRADFMADETTCAMVEYGSNGRKLRIEAADPVRGGDKQRDVEDMDVDSDDQRKVEELTDAANSTMDWDPRELAGLLDKDLEEHAEDTIPDDNFGPMAEADGAPSLTSPFQSMPIRQPDDEDDVTEESDEAEDEESHLSMLASQMNPVSSLAEASHVAGGTDEEDESEEDVSEDEDEDEDDEEEDDYEEDEEDFAEQVALLNQEIDALKVRVNDMMNKTAAATNVILKRRLEDGLRKLQAELDFKQQQIQDIKNKAAGVNGDSSKQVTSAAVGPGQVGAKVPAPFVMASHSTSGKEGSKTTMGASKTTLHDQMDEDESEEDED